MPEELKLFTQKLVESYAPTPVLFESISLPPYAWPIGNKIGDVLTKLGYEISTGGNARSNKRFIVSHPKHGISYYWHSRGLNVLYGHSGSEVGVEIFSSEIRKNEAFKIAKEIENKITEDVKKYLKQLKDEDFTKRAKERIPTLK